jgi:flagellar protein FliS
MTTAAQLRSRYAREAVTTASPARLVTMLYDRLVRDLDDAELAISLSDVQATHTSLRHAQDIVQELSSSLDVSRWDGGTSLQSLYTWLLERLVAANMTKDAAVVTECREVVEPLRDAWHEAANLQSVVAS